MSRFSSFAPRTHAAASGSSRTALPLPSTRGRCIADLIREKLLKVVTKSKAERRHPSMFEPIHGSAFDITGKGIANPVAIFWTTVQMLEHLGEPESAARLMSAIERTTAAGVFTPDVSGTATTKDVT